MKKKWLSLILLGLVMILAVPAMAGCSIPTAAQSTSSGIQVSQQPQGIWVSGIGELSVTPDIATLTLGVTAQEANVSLAQSKSSEAMAKVMKALADSRIDPKDIQTGRFSINQRTRWDESRQTDAIIGYQVTNMVIVKIRDTSKVSSIIDAVVLAGGDIIRISGINFSVEDPSKYYQEVRSQAIAVAKSKADELAKLAGVKLGSPTYIAENAQYSPTYGGYSNVSVAIPAPAMGMSSAPISTGETKITLSVQVAYSITQ